MISSVEKVGHRLVARRNAQRPIPLGLGGMRFEQGYRRRCAHGQQRHGRNSHGESIAGHELAHPVPGVVRAREYRLVVQITPQVIGKFLHR